MQHMPFNRGPALPVRAVGRGLLALGVFLVLLSVAPPAAAHDNLGGDEMSMAIAIFIAGLVTIAGAIFGLLWAAKTGQFNNVEQAKYAMLENAEDLDDLPVVGPGGLPARLQGDHHAAK